LNKKRFLIFFLNYNFTRAIPSLSPLQKLCQGQQCTNAVAHQMTIVLELLTGVKT